MRRDIEFKSGGETCRGWFYTPDQGAPPFPTVVMAGGWCYVKEIVMPHYADFFVRQGLAVLIFDYRTFGLSDGSPRQHINPYGQIEDYRNAITFVETLPEVDAERIGIWGISYSGGHVLIVGALDPRVKCIVSNLPVVDGYANQKRAHGEQRFARLLEAIMGDRRRRFQDENNRAYIAMSAPDPETTLCAWPFPEVYEVFSQLEKTEAPRHEHRSTLESVELLHSYTVFPYVGRIVNTPTLMIVAEGDNITLWDLEIEAFRQISAWQKRLFVVPKTTHMTLYSNRSKLEIAAEEAAKWFEEKLIAPYRVTVPA
ncbi:MAG: alpha/beta hydrolase [Dehalococcoidia bacterium]